MEPRYNNHGRGRISGDEGAAGYQRRRPALLPPLRSSSSPSRSLNNRRSVFAVRTERHQRLRPPAATTIAPSPPSPALHDCAPRAPRSPSTRRSSSPSDPEPDPLVASAPETTASAPFGPSEAPCAAPCSSSSDGCGGDDKKETMRAESRVCRRWSLARPMSSEPPEISALIPRRCTADDTMTGGQPASSRPSSCAPRIARIPPGGFARWLLLLALLALFTLSAPARAHQDGSANPYEYSLEPPANRSQNLTAIQILGRQAFDSLKAERVIEPPLDSQVQRKEKWVQRHRNRKEKNERRGRKKLKGEQKENFIATREQIPKLENTCVGVKITQRVRMAGCLSKVVHNRYCHGSCTSVFIPRLRAKKLKATFESCSACLPSDYDRVQVKLECPNRQDTPVLVRRVIKVKKCSCLSQCEIRNT
uniref:Bursicon n=1 Tax=Steinernema glaseri TaxID=37863 RepID=A0A1I8A7U4_9BILA